MARKKSQPRQHNIISFSALILFIIFIIIAWFMPKHRESQTNLQLPNETSFVFSSEDSLIIQDKLHFIDSMLIVLKND